MSELTVIIKGIAFCRPAAAGTQVLFPHAPGHKLKVSRAVFGGLADPPQTFPGENVLAITLEGKASPMDPVPPVNDLINIVDWHLQAGSSLKFKQRNPDARSMRISFLSLPAPKIFSSGPSEHKFEIWAHRTKGGSPPLRDYLGQPAGLNLAEEAMVKFQIPGAPAAVKLTINGNLVQTFQHQAGVNFVLTLDNHCHNQPCIADFGYYYEMLEGTDNKGYNVELDEFPIRIPSVSIIDADSEAACNPVYGDTECDLNTWRLGGAGCVAPLTGTNASLSKGAKKS